MASFHIASIITLVVPKWAAGVFVFGLEAVEVIFMAALIAQAVWAVRLWTLCLTGRYKGLAAYLTVATIWGVVASLFRHVIPLIVENSPGVWSSFAWFYVVTRPIIWVLFFIVLYECYERMVDRYPGVRRAGQLALYTAIGAAGALIVGLTITNPEDAGTMKYWYRMIVAHDESVYIGAAAAVLFLVLFRRFFSLPLPGNVGVVFSVFGVYFIGSAALYVAENLTLSDGFAAGLGVAGSLLYLTCLTFGLLRFSPSGEATADDFRPGSQGAAVAASNSAERRLRLINDQLTRALHV